MYIHTHLHAIQIFYIANKMLFICYKGEDYEAACVMLPFWQSAPEF